MISKLELRRQVLHIGFGSFLITMLYLAWFNIYHMFAILIVGVVLSRLCKSYRVPVASWVMDHFEREEFRKTVPGKGPIFFMIGSIIVLYFFPLKIALASMVMLTIGDAMSHIFGKLLSKRTYKHLKSVEGTIAGILFSFLGALLFVDVVLALVGSLITMGLEGVKFKIEDNLYIPIVASIVMSLLLLF
tara:strand:+ start:5556 stop:6122 length:567 start_codon:yes stop_codon:yes gene_type:complete